MSAPPPPTATTTGCPPAAPRLENPPGPEEPLLPSPLLRASPRSVLRAQPDWGGQLRPRKLRRVRALGRTPLLGRWPRRSSLLCLFSGIRTEQDFYVRLIDSMTKQVGAAGSGRGKGECVRTCMCACLGGGAAGGAAKPGSGSQRERLRRRRGGKGGREPPRSPLRTRGGRRAALRGPTPASGLRGALERRPGALRKNLDDFQPARPGGC